MQTRLYRRGLVLRRIPKLKVSSAFGRKRKRQLEGLLYLRVKGESVRDKYARIFVMCLRCKIMSVVRGSDINYLAKDTPKGKIIDDRVKFIKSKGDKELLMEFQGPDNIVGLELFQ